MFIFNTIRDLGNAQLLEHDLIHIMGENTIGDRAPMTGIVRKNDFITANRKVPITNNMFVEVFPDTVIADFNADTATIAVTGSTVRRTLKARADEFLQIGDFATEAEAITYAVNNKAAIANATTPYKVFVGSGSPFKTINDAIIALSKVKPAVVLGGGFSEIVLKSGFTMAEQIILDNGQDLSWIRITAEDAVVPVDHTKITIALSDKESSMFPIFGARNSSTLPVIGCKFAYSSNTTAKDGIAVIVNSNVQMLPGAGVVRAFNGLRVLYGSTAVCYMEGLVSGGGGTGAGDVLGVDFSYAKNRGLHVAHGSMANLARSNFSYSGGDYGVYCIWNSRADLYQSDASHAAGTAFNCRDGSIMNCRESSASHSKRGFHALHAGIINARSKADGSQDKWVKDSAKFCSQYGILASGSSRVEAAEVDVSGCTGSAGCSASDSSTVSFQLGTALDCKTRGVWSQGGSVVHCDGVDVSGSKMGFVADNGATITAQSISRTSKANNCYDFGCLATNGSRITFGKGEASGCGRTIEAREGSMISARGAILTNARARAVSAIAGAEICAIEADLSGSQDRAITSRDGSRVSATGSKINVPSVIWDAEVTEGGLIFLGTATGFIKFNIDRNQFTPAGTIYEATPTTYKPNDAETYGI
ncbi:MAG: hypothetical protein ACRC42_01270 [Mycoplasma sp.]